MKMGNEFPQGTIHETALCLRCRNEHPYPYQFDSEKIAVWCICGSLGPSRINREEAVIEWNSMNDPSFAGYEI